MRLDRGILVVFEGIDGAGKTTQARMLRDRLCTAGIDTILTKQPSGGPWGRKIRQSARTGRLPVDEEYRAFVEDRKEHVREVISPALKDGFVVIVDRYYFSTVAYQGARGMDVDRILAENEAIAPRPDLLFIMNIDPALGLSRVRRRDGVPDEFERVDLLSESAAIFIRIAGDAVHLDGRQPIPVLHSAIVEHLKNGPLFDQLPVSNRYSATSPVIECAALHALRALDASEAPDAPGASATP